MVQKFTCVGRWGLLLYLVMAVGLLQMRVHAQDVNDFMAGTYVDPQHHTLPYRLFVPANYDPTQEYPLVLFLHGSGERGDDNKLQLTGQTAPLVFVQSDNQKQYPCFMLAPQCPTTDGWIEAPFNASYSINQVPESPSLATVLELMSSLEQQYSLDTSRLYVTGLSMGGFGTWDLILRHPNLFAAAVPIASGGDPSQAALIAQTPIWDFHSADDGAVPVSTSRDMIAALQAAGGHPLYTEYPSGGHQYAWTQGYADPGLLPWLFAQRLAPADVPEPGVGDLFLGTGTFGLLLMIRRRLAKA